MRMYAALLWALVAADVAVAQTPPELARFAAERARIAANLSVPIVSCLARRDTDRPLFHGCVDWHSSVHGVWALTAYSWATGDERYKPALRSMLDPGRIAEEQQFVSGNRDFEMPYGRSWFLRLAVDYKRLFQDDLLDNFARMVADSLVDRYKAKAPDPTSGAYDSDSWALINLDSYAETVGDAKLRDFVAAQIRANFLDVGACPAAAAEVASGEFMAICTNWAWLVSKILPRDEFIAWLERFLPRTQPLSPITEVSTVHQSGLNFSRAWGLWALYRKTGDQYWLSSYLAHVHQTYDRPAEWKGGYWTVGHWVPQFGMLAVMMSYYDPP